MKIRKGDTVKMLSGKDRGKTGKVLHALPSEEKVSVEGLNLMKKHLRPRKRGERGQIASIPMLVSVAKVMLVCPKCARSARVGYGIAEGRKHRACKKCGSEI